MPGSPNDSSRDAYRGRGSRSGLGKGYRPAAPRRGSAATLRSAVQPDVTVQSNARRRSRDNVENLYSGLHRLTSMSSHHSSMGASSDHTVANLIASGSSAA